MRKASVALSVSLMAMVLVGLATRAEAETTKTVSYGPYTVAAGSMDMPTMYDRLRLGVSRPCSDCYITSFQADLKADGTTANFDTGMMLHHVVFTSQFRSDATCSGTYLGLAGERFFASGNERTRISFPDGYGYRVRWWDSWNMYLSLMNMMPTSQTAYIHVTFTLAPTSANLKAVKPVWLDINQCGDSEYTITPPPPEEKMWTWTVNVPGRVVAAAGHLHDFGDHIKATDTTTGKLICDSSAGYGTKPAYMGHIESMSTCVKDFLARVHSGDKVVLDSFYNSPEARDDVMGIMLIYVYRTG